MIQTDYFYVIKNHNQILGDESFEKGVAYVCANVVCL